MIIVEDVLLSEEILDRKFACQLDKCKGACCVEGDAGAPLLHSDKSTDKSATFAPQMSKVNLALKCKHDIQLVPELMLVILACGIYCCLVWGCGA